MHAMFFVEQILGLMLKREMLSMFLTLWSRGYVATVILVALDTALRTLRLSFIVLGHNVPQFTQYSSVLTSQLLRASILRLRRGLTGTHSAFRGSKPYLQRCNSVIRCLSLPAETWPLRVRLFYFSLTLRKFLIFPLN